jgi:hypothetical protein
MFFENRKISSLKPVRSRTVLTVLPTGGYDHSTNFNQYRSSSLGRCLCTYYVLKEA